MKYGWLSSWKEATPYEAEDIFKGSLDFVVRVCVWGHKLLLIVQVTLTFTGMQLDRCACWNAIQEKSSSGIKFSVDDITRWWFQIFVIFAPTCGKWSNLTSIFFEMGWFNHEVDSKSPPTYVPMDAAYPMTDGRPLLVFYAPAWSRGWGGCWNAIKVDPKIYPPWSQTEIHLSNHPFFRGELLVSGRVLPWLEVVGFYSGIRPP